MQKPSSFLLAGQLPPAGQIEVASRSSSALSRSSPVFFLLKLENNHPDLCTRDPKNSAPAKSKSIRSSFGGRRRSKSFHARSITRRKLLNRLQIIYTLQRVIYIKKQLRDIERRRRQDYYRNLRRSRRSVFFLLARTRKAEKEAQNKLETRPSRAARRTGSADMPASSRTARLFSVLSALEERQRIKAEREKSTKQEFQRRAA